MKYKKTLILSFILFNLFAMVLSTRVNAQADYDLEPEEDDSFVWEIVELNKHEFEKTFGFEPNFDVGDKTKRTIEDIDDVDDGWVVTSELWGFDDDFDDDGAVDYENVYDSPGNYDDNIFLPAPVHEYLDEAQDSLPSEYIVDGLTVTKRETDYNVIREYDARGVMIVEMYENQDGIVIVKVEGTFRVIPMGNFYIGFIALAIASIIIITIRKKKFFIKDS